MAGSRTDLEIEQYLKRRLGALFKRVSPEGLDEARLMADLGLDGDAFYDFAEAFADEFCSPLHPPAPGPKGAVEICPPDLTIREWKSIGRSGAWPQGYWAVA